MSAPVFHVRKLSKVVLESTVPGDAGPKVLEALTSILEAFDLSPWIVKEKVVDFRLAYVLLILFNDGFLATSVVVKVETTRVCFT